MVRPAGATLLSALGFGSETGLLYERLLPRTDTSVEEIASGLGLSPEELLALAQPLLSAGIVTLEDSRLLVETPAEAVGRMLRETADGAAAAHARLQDIAAALPYLAMTTKGLVPQLVQGVDPLDGEITAGGGVTDILERFLPKSTGDVLLLRPDQWALPTESRMIDLMAQIIADGRRVRAIYPVRILAEAPGIVMARSKIGEEIRVLPEVPTRMMIIGTTHAILPEPLGNADSPRSLVRQRGLVEALTLLFEQYWDRSLPVSGIDRIDTRSDVRRFLLEQLAAGAQDEQIARRLGVSLRTVRRRVAELMQELGADSRFQAGVEAVRRGWL